MTRFSALRYLTCSVRLRQEQADALLDEAERDGQATALVAEAERREGVTDERATVTCARGVYEVRRPGFSHGMHYNYLDDLHPVGCGQCYCKHYRHDGRSSVLAGDPPATCRCGHPAARHEYREIRQTLDICTHPETWFTDDLRAFCALLS